MVNSDSSFVSIMVCLSDSSLIGCILLTILNINVIYLENPPRFGRTGSGIFSLCHTV